MTQMIEKIMGRPILPHPHQISRIWFPKYTEHTTPMHQDFVHFQGNFETLTSWAPIGDCPIELGGLAVIPGSHKVERVLDHHFSLGAGGLAVDVDQEQEIEPIWYSTDYEAGDTLIFPALMIHRALPNYTEGPGCGSRWTTVTSQSAIRSRSHARNHTAPAGLTWEEVYKDWELDE